MKPHETVESERRQYLSRFSKLPGIGEEGLERLRCSKVAIVGCGGVGSVVADYLARSGIGNLRLVDQDVVGPSNLHRMHLVDSQDLYQPKVEAIARSLERRQPWLGIETVVDTLREDNVEELIGKPDLIIDGLDNFRTRYVLNRYSIQNRIPYLFTSAVANQAHASLFDPKETGCLTCLFPSTVSAGQEDSCESLGVTATIVGIIGGIVADETVKHLLGMGSGIRGRLLTVDLAGPDFLFSKVSKRTDCLECGQYRSEKSPSETSRTVTMLCGEHTASVVPTEHRTLDLLSMSKLVGHDRILACSDQALVYREGRTIVSVFKSARLILDGVESEEDAVAQASRVWERLGVQSSS